MPACKNLIGKQFGYLTVIEKTEKRLRGNVVWLCKCKCGNYKEAIAADLNRGAVLSCGCYNKEQVAKNFNNLLNKKFGRLTVIEKTDQRTKNRAIIWKCQCECGNIHFISSDTLLNQHVQSCGCLQRERAKEAGKAGIDLLNKKFGKLTPIKLLTNKEKRT